MSETRAIENGRCIALYPGAFRPPHQAHLTAVRALAARSDVDEVVIVISNRCRILPGTTKALGSEVAQAIWGIYLDGLPEASAKVRLEVAGHTAVAQALGYFERVQPGDRLLFCIGAADLSAGDDRFSSLPELALKHGVSAALVPAPTGDIAVRSTDLRNLLVLGPEGEKAFMAALPGFLSPRQRKAVWALCSKGLRDFSEIIGKKLRAILAKSSLGEPRAIVPVRGGKLDPVFRANYPGRTCFVKYAGDTVSSGVLGDRLSPKPRRRLSAERRALKRLRDLKLDREVALPEVLLFEKKTLTLVLSELCPGGRSLLEELKRGRFDPGIAAALGAFLAACHTLAFPIKAVWGEEESDQRHWEAVLALRSLKNKQDGLSEQARRQLNALRLKSDRFAQNKGMQQILILDCVPKNILLRDEKIGLVDLESCASIGDPACDLGLFLGHLLLWGLVHNAPHSAGQALGAALKAYQRRAKGLWPEIASRVSAFSGALLIRPLPADRPPDLRGLAEKTSAAGHSLLAAQAGSVEDAEAALHRVVAGRSE